MSLAFLQPANQNPAQGTKFRLNFDRLPYLTFFCMSVNLPGVSFPEIPRASPFSDTPIPGDKIRYEELNISFMIDEDYRSWLSVHDWIRGVTFPTNFDEYKNLGKLQRSSPLSQLVKQTDRPQYSDAILTIYTNKNNPNIRVKFRECFPTSLSSVVFNTQDDADVILTGQSTFKFAWYDIERL